MKRKLGSDWDPNHKKRRKQRHQEEEEEESTDYDDYRDPRGDGSEDPEGTGEGAVHQSVHSFETLADVASLSASPGVAAVAAIEVNFDTGAAVTVLPERYVTQPRDNGVRYKTASGEALRDQGKAEVTGTLPGGRGATITEGPGSTGCCYPVPRRARRTLRFCTERGDFWFSKEVLSPRRPTSFCASWRGNTKVLRQRCR